MSFHGLGKKIVIMSFHVRLISDKVVSNYNYQIGGNCEADMYPQAGLIPCISV